ncbi:Uncharacterized protein FWK35_00018606 [Aphis craccivora]|uniref:Uncharacterized protein n=1 Tax=Aphis craccivora TaxID=307492 RepID=A0A6G0X184_APHCR|nr:Uncharacterized protein FWK35_00018606 [Aphis craccivora]
MFTSLDLIFHCYNVLPPTCRCDGGRKFPPLRQKMAVSCGRR